MQSNCVFVKILSEHNVVFSNGFMQVLHFPLGHKQPSSVVVPFTDISTPLFPCSLLGVDQGGMAAHLPIHLHLLYPWLFAGIISDLPIHLHLLYPWLFAGIMSDLPIHISSILGCLLG